MVTNKVLLTSSHLFLDLAILDCKAEKYGFDFSRWMSMPVFSDWDQDESEHVSMAVSGRHMFRNENEAITLSVTMHWKSRFLMRDNAVALNVVIKKLQTHENEKRLARVLSSKSTILHALSRSLSRYIPAFRQSRRWIRAAHFWKAPGSEACVMSGFCRTAVRKTSKNPW